jgi:hypothetical protein
MQAQSQQYLRILALSGAFVVAGCTTVTMSEPPQTATEQLLVTTAIDDAIAKMNVSSIAAGTRIFVDTSFFDGTGRDRTILFPKYAMGAVRERLLRAGALLTDDKQTAEVIVELRTGGQSVDHNSLFVGIPSITIPIPPYFTAPVTTPELSLFKRDRKTGVAKLAIVAYGRGTGALTGESGASFGASNHTEYTVLLLFDWISGDIEPKELQDRTK